MEFNRSLRLYRVLRFPFVEEFADWTGLLAGAEKLERGVRAQLFHTGRLG